MITLAEIKAAKTKGLTDLGLLAPVIQSKDAHDEFFKTGNYYVWYQAICRVVQPAVIAEIGVRFGYSLYAMASGCEKPPIVYGYDNGSYEPTWLEVSERNLKPMVGAGLILRQRDTQTRDELPFGPVDLFHVDGDHSTPGALCDLYLALRHTRTGGLILLDDVDFLPDVAKAAAIWRHVLPANLYVPTRRGLQVFLVG